MRKLYLFHFLVSLVGAAFWSCWAATFAIHGETLENMALIVAGIYIAQAIFEIPTGFTADIYGRKRVSIVGFALMGVGFLLVGLVPSVLGAFVGFFVAGFGLTLMSGAVNAWLFGLARDLDEGGLVGQGASQNYFMNTNLVARLATIAGAFGGIQILEYYPESFWKIFGVITLVFAAYGVLLERSTTDRSSPEERAEFRFASLLEYVKQPVLFLTVLSIVLFGLETGIRSLVAQPYVLKIGSGELIYLAYMQVVFALLRMAGILLFKKLSFFRSANNQRLAMVASLLIFGLAEILNSQIRDFWVFISIYGVAVMTLGWHFPLRDDFINSIIPEKLRATLLSVDASAYNFASAFVLILLSQRIGDEQLFSLWIFGGMAAIASGLVLLSATRFRASSSL